MMPGRTRPAIAELGSDLLPDLYFLSASLRGDKLSCVESTVGGRSLGYLFRRREHHGARHSCSPRNEEAVIMRKIVASLSMLLMFATITAMAQEKMKEPSNSGHEGMAKASGAQSDAAIIAKATSAAPPDIARYAAVVGMGADGKMKELRAGTNGWACMLNLAGDSMCLDKEWQAWGDAWMNKKDPPKPQTVGVAYLLKGAQGASNTDPYATKPTADNHWVVSGPHIMILPTDVSQLDAYPTDWTKGGPWVMWKGTPYAHIMVPVTSMAKSTSKARVEKKANDNTK